MKLDVLLAEVTEAMTADITWDGLPEVVGDPLRLGQVLANLVSNAVKFVTDGAVPRVFVTAERTASDDGWVVSVVANGIGVPPEQRESIFGMFTRLHPRGRYEGTGIGLAVCKRIVEARGGTNGVEGAVGGGSR